MGQRFAGSDLVEILVIEDGCKDGTREYLNELSQSEWGQKVLRWFHEDDVNELKRRLMAAEDQDDSQDRSQESHFEISQEGHLFHLLRLLTDSSSVEFGEIKVQSSALMLLPAMDKLQRA